MTNPSRKRVVTSDDLDTLNRNSAYARTQGEAAQTGAAQATTAAQQADTARANLNTTIAGAARDAALSATAAATGRVNTAIDQSAAASASLQSANRIALDAAIADVRQQAVTGVPLPVLARPPEIDTFSAAQGWRSGTVNAQQGYTVRAGTATVDAALGRLTVTANATNGAGAGLLTPYGLHEGTYRIPVYSGVPVLMWGGDGQPSGPTYAVWRDGNAVQVGAWNVKPWGNAEDITVFATVPVPAAEPYWIELLLTLRAFVVRTWAMSANRAVAQLAVVQINNDAPLALPGGPLRLATLGNGPAVFGPVLVDSYERQPNPLTAKAQPIGPWMGVVEGQLNCMATYTSGAELRLHLEQVSGLALNLLIPEGQSYPPVLATRYREVGGGWTAWSRMATPGGNPGDVVRVDPLTGLNPAKKYDVHICANIDENDHHYTRRCGLIVQDVIVSAGGRVTALREPERLRAMGVGDSKLAGIVGFGHNAQGPVSTPSQTGSEWSWLHVACDLLGAIPIHNGYGGTGVTVPGSGDMPPALTNVSNNMLNWPGKTFYPGDPDLIFIEDGHNDDGANNRNPPARPTEAEFQARYRELCLYLLGRYPAAMVVPVRPFNGGFWAQIQAVAAELGLEAMDTTGWLNQNEGDYAPNDPVHPLVFPEGTDKGHRKAGRLAFQWAAARGVPARAM